MPTFDTPEPISVVIALIVGDARVIASDRTDTVVQVSPSDRSSEADVKAAEQTRVEFAHGRLLVKTPKQWRHYNPFSSVESVDVVIELPLDSQVQGDASVADFRGEGRLGECRFTTATGHIWLDHTGPLQLNTGVGSITVDRAEGRAEVTGAGEVRIREIDGAAVIKNLNGGTRIGEVTGNLRCNAANGDISVDRAHATIEAKTANGSIRIGEVVRGSVTLGTAFGELEVGIREGTAALLDVRSQFGRVRTSLDPSDGPEPSDETVEVRARTSYGDIVVRRSTDTRPDEFTERSTTNMTITSPRAATVHHNVSEPGQAQRNRLARDRLVAQDAVHNARCLSIPVINVDGNRDADTIADIVANYFLRYLPPPQQH